LTSPFLLGGWANVLEAKVVHNTKMQHRDWATHQQNEQDF